MSGKTEIYQNYYYVTTVKINLLFAQYNIYCVFKRSLKTDFYY